MSPASPKKPLGRTRRTSAITTKTMISASLGAKKVVIAHHLPHHDPGHHRAEQAAHSPHDDDHERLDDHGDAHLP